MASTSSYSPRDIARSLTVKHNYGINMKELEKCITVLKKPAPQDGFLYCPPTFDHWLCWDHARAGTTVRTQCPHDFKSGFSSDAFAEKTCMQNGSWYKYPATNNTWTDYTKCSSPEKDQLTLYISISGYSISCLLLAVSIAIFGSFRQLRCTRVVLHQHLFVSFILTGIMWIITYSQFLAKPEIRQYNPTWCKVIHILTQYASVSNYFWMFCEGFFLHTIIVHAFSKQRRLLLVCSTIGWGLPSLPVAAYVSARALDTINDIMCWFHPTWTLWILSTPIVVSLLINFMLLLNILRILLSKIRAFNTAEHNQNRRAVKATLILVPLLGLQNLLTLVRPPLEDQAAFAWNMASTVLVSYQGAAVALIFCFLNGEVLTVLKRKWHQWRHNYDPAFVGRPSSNSTTVVIALDDAINTSVVLRNGTTETCTIKVKETMEMQQIMPDSNTDKGTQA